MRIQETRLSIVSATIKQGAATSPRQHQRPFRKKDEENNKKKRRDSILRVVERPPVEPTQDRTNRSTDVPKYREAPKQPRHEIGMFVFRANSTLKMLQLSLYLLEGKAARAICGILLWNWEPGTDDGVGYFWGGF